jgi:beta-phosphoglucomutase-like phosphatase (HAD superfamily)
MSRDTVKAVASVPGGGRTYLRLSACICGFKRGGSVLRGVILDMDGVLVDTEAWICRAATAMFAERGLAVKPEDFMPFVGAGEDRYLGGVAEKYGFRFDLERDKARTYRLYAELVRGKLEPLPGAREFIAAGRKRGLKLALATSADRVKMEVTRRSSCWPPGGWACPPASVSSSRTRSTAWPPPRPPAAAAWR